MSRVPFYDRAWLRFVRVWGPIIAFVTCLAEVSLFFLNETNFTSLTHSTFAVLIKEQEYSKMESILRAIPPEKVCAMRKEALRVYETYFATFDAQLEAVMQIFDARAAGTARKLPIDWKEVCRNYPCPS
jgi:hypothetical protein